MMHRLAWVLPLVLSVASLTTAQQRIDLDTGSLRGPSVLLPQDPPRLTQDPRRETLSETTLTETTITERIREPRFDASFATQQDYSPRALYMDTHGDFVSKMQRYDPMIKGSLSWMPGASIKGEPGDFDQTWVRADAKIPFVTGTDTTLIAGGYFQARRFETSSAFGGVGDETVYGTGINIGLNQFIDDDLMISGLWSPGVYSDWDGTLTKKDWQFNGHVLATYRQHETLFFKGGLMWSQDFADVGVFPLAGLSWLFHPRWRVDVLLPKKVEVSWNPDPAVIIHAGVDLEGYRYRVRSSLGSGKVSSNIYAQDISLTAGGIYRFNDNVSTFARVGGVLAGDYKFRGPGGSRQNGTLDPTFFVEVGFGIDF